MDGIFVLTSLPVPGERRCGGYGKDDEGEENEEEEEVLTRVMSHQYSHDHSKFELSLNFDQNSPIYFPEHPLLAKGQISIYPNI